MRRGRAGQEGFTLIELMVATTLVVILMTGVGGVLVDTQRNIEAVVSQISLSREARGIFDMLALGGYRNNINMASVSPVTSINNSEDFNYVFGLRSRYYVSATSSSGWARPTVRTSDVPTSNIAEFRLLVGGVSLYRFALSPNSLSPDLTVNGFATQQDGASSLLMGEQLPGGGSGLSVSCTGADTPLRGCADSSSMVTSWGFLQGNPISDKDAYETTHPLQFGIAVQLIDPRRLSSPNAREKDFSSTYWFQFNSLVVLNGSNPLY